MYMYLLSHPYTTHAIKFNPDNLKSVPNFIGPPLPQKDQGDCEYYCLHFLNPGILEVAWRH